MKWLAGKEEQWQIISPLPLPCPPSHPCPLLFFFFQLLYFPHSLACKTGRIFFVCLSQGNGSKCKVQVICKGRRAKSLPCPCLCLPYKHKKITAVLLAMSFLSREPVQRLIDLAKKMCIYCIATSVQHTCTDLKIMLKMCFLL